MQVTGRVIEEQKNYFVVTTPSGQVMATTAGVLKKKRKRVCTGDIVDITLLDAIPPFRGVITIVHQRSTYINRPALANCSHILCVCTYKEPPLNLEILDQLLFTAQVFGLKPCIILNKIDQHTRQEQKDAEKIFSFYPHAGIPFFSVSSTTGKNIDKIIEFCTGKISACTGISGVGKSTMLSSIFPDQIFRIGELSATANRGTHTTTNVTLLSIPAGGFIADTPGLAMIDLPPVPEEEVVLYFQELASCIGKCRFNNCMHNQEPGCLVRELVEKGAIAPWRYTHYLKIFNLMREKNRNYR